MFSRLAEALKNGRFRAVIFDLDGVITDTAKRHFESWKTMFDAYLETRKGAGGSFTREDYLTYVDGKPRYDGVASFLESRSIRLSRGTPHDSPDAETVCGLGNRKNDVFHAMIERYGVEVFADAVPFVETLHDLGVRTAIVTSSRNGASIMKSAGITALFSERVDGNDLAGSGLRGKPAPDLFLEAARRLHVEPSQAVVAEDAVAGVQAGRAGGVGCVIGVARNGSERALIENGADVVVHAFSEIPVTSDAHLQKLAADLPVALDQIDSLFSKAGARSPVFFLDYDGTLTPIVERPEDAVLSAAMREALTALAARATVAIVSGRDLADVRKRVGLDRLYYAGSHGFDLAGPDGWRHEHPEGHRFLRSLDAVEGALGKAVAAIEGAQVERKRYAVAVHYRRAAPDDWPKVEAAVDAALADHHDLRKTGGKMIFELRPAIDWDKGRAVLWMLDALGLDATSHLPVYIGDDETDEDAFRALSGIGVGILVRDDETDSTLATYVLNGTDEVRKLLRAVGDRLGEAAA